MMNHKDYLKTINGVDGVNDCAPIAQSFQRSGGGVEPFATGYSSLLHLWLPFLNRSSTLPIGSIANVSLRM